MAENLTPQPNIEIVRDLLSPYLDDEVTDEERALVDAALADSPELRDELDELRHTVALVSEMPRVPAPRPFTLTQADVQAVAPKPKKSFGLPAWLGGFAAAAALLVCVLAVGGLFWTSQFSNGGMAGDIAMAPQQAIEEAAMEQPVAEEPAAEEAPAEEEYAVEQEAPAAEAPAAELPMEEAAEAELVMETVEEEAAKESVVEEKAAADAPNLAPPAQATDTAGIASDTDTAESVGEAGLGVQPQPTQTPAALSTTTPTPNPTLPAPMAPGEARDAVSESSAPEMEDGAMPEGESGAVVPDEQDDLVQKEEIPLETDTQATATAPSPTVIALLTILPSDTPDVQATPTQEVEAVPSSGEVPIRTSILTGLIFILLIVGGIVIGLVVRWIRKQN